MKLLRTILMGGLAVIFMISAAPSLLAAEIVDVSRFATVGFGPADLVFDAEGNLYTADYYNLTISKVTPAGTVSVFADLSDYSEANSLAFDTAGNLYVATYTTNSTVAPGVIVKITPSGVVSTFATVGRWPGDIIFDTNGNLYAANYLDGTVSKITSGGTVSTFATMPSGYVGGLIFDANGNLYAGNPVPLSSISRVIKITPAGNVSTFATESYGFGISVMDSAGNFYGRNSYTDKVYKVTPAGTVSVYADLNSFTSNTNYGDMVFDTAGNLYIADRAINSTSGFILKITPTGVVSMLATVEKWPTSLKFDTVGNLYIANFGTNTVSKITFATPPTATIIIPTGDISVALAQTISFSGVGTAVAGSAGARIDYPASSILYSASYGIAFDPVTNSVWVANAAVNTVSKINVTTGTPPIDYAVGNGPVDIAFDSVTNSIWVANSTSNTVSKVNITTGSVIGTYSVGSYPYSVAFDSVTNSIWVANSVSSTVSKVNITTGSVIGTYSVGAWPQDVTFDLVTNSVWVANGADNTVSKINVTTGAIVGTYSVDWVPYGVAFDSFTNSVWSVNASQNTVSKISTGGNSITNYEWREGNCNTGTLLSSTSSFNKSDLTVGSHTVYLRVMDSLGVWSNNCPSRTIIVTPANTSAAPTITGSTTLITGTNGTYTFTATDPQGDQIRYGIDWDMDSIADEWLPAGATYVNSGTTRGTAHSWVTAGVKIFQALTQDFSGLNSAWAPYTVTVSTPPVCTAINPTVVWSQCVTVPAQCVGLPSPRDVDGTQSGVCTDGATGAVFRGCTVYGQVCTVPQSAVCGDGICNVPETLLSCPKDCKAQYKQF